MKIFKHIKIAEDMGLDKTFAIRARQRYLTKERKDAIEDANFYSSYWCGGNLVGHYFALRCLRGSIKQRKLIEKELSVIKRMVHMKEQEITDEMIISARSYPVDRLIDFGRSKKAKAFCHEDKNPSMYHGTKINKAMCPVCNKAFDSIAILMKRDMMSFKDAVKQLSGGL